LVTVTNGITTVRHVWTAYFATSPAASFVVGEALTWTGGGVGVVTSWDGALKRLRFTRTSGGFPAVGNVVTGGTSGATGPIAERGEFDPPDFDGLLTPANTNLFSVIGTPYVYQLTTTITEDNFVLSSAYTQPTQLEAPYGIAVSYTPNLKLPLLEYGDADAPSMISRAFGILDARFPVPYVHARHTAAANVAGGTFTSGAWQIRTLNSLVASTVSGVSLGSNRLSGVPAGTYDVLGWAIGHNCGVHRLRLRNITGGSDLLLGAVVGGGSTNMGVGAPIAGRITLSTTSALELWHRCQTTSASTGWGNPSNWDSLTEVYADLLLTKVL
jgi:hypothetical protein